MKMKMKMKNRGQGKLLNKSIKVRGQWKAVDLDPSLFSEEGLEGLVCFEELTSYRLVDSEKAASQAAKMLQKEKMAKKRKASEEGEGEGVEESSTPEPAKKKAKKKKKKKAPVEDKSEETPDMTQEPNKVEENVMQDEIKVQQDVMQEENKVEQDALSSEPKQLKKKNKKQQKRKEKMEIEKASGVADPGTENKEAVPKKKQLKNWTEAGLDVSQNCDVSAWTDLFVPAEVLKALSSLGFSAPTPIQALVLPAAIRDRLDILGAAETGSGKTLAYGIPMIHSILEWKSSGKQQEREDEEPQKVESLYLPDAGFDKEEEEEEEEEEVPELTAAEEQGDEDELRGCVPLIENAVFGFEGGISAPSDDSQPLLGLVLTPTRELAVQVKHHIDAVAKFAGVRTAIVVGGMSLLKQRRILKRRPEIVIATPGRLWDLIREQHPHLQNLRQLRCLVIDEADRMVERGHFAELENLLELLNTTYFNPSRQSFVFSATLTMAPVLPSRVLQKKRNPEKRDKVALLMEKVGIKSKPKIVDLTRKEATAETLLETLIHCQKDEKDFFLYYFLLQYPGRTMVFANSIECIKRLNSLLIILDCNPMPLHANMHQKQRLKNLERFADRQSCVLLTTDVAARGLDIPNVQYVIHYQVPRTSETYVHRSGRTARASKEGLSLMMVGPEDMINFKKIYKTLGKDDDLPLFPVETKYMEAIKERVNLARQIEKIEFYNSRQKQHDSWFKHAAEAMEVDLDEDLLMGGSSQDDEDRQQKKMVKSMKKHLKSLTSQPVFKNIIKTKYPTQMGHLPLPHVLQCGDQSAISRVSEQQQKHILKKNNQSQSKKKRKNKKRQKQQQQE
ncbi:ATP-dependent RNA helicase DDX24 [Synchiropus splendidus]|uniref:ATP-dependent RNA helicase DDX24 n=1 Tax=Synchiropus splendidus TaxID=270530 RepID=UPI00237E08CB|nr:ATP-dependent RNA helicase DDX24 [Synchiropus splendidus]